MPQDNATLLQEAYDNLVAEYHQHTADRLLGKYKTNYTLNGRTFDWLGYRKAITQELKDLAQILASTNVGYAEVIIR